MEKLSAAKIFVEQLKKFSFANKYKLKLTRIQKKKIYILLFLSVMETETPLGTLNRGDLIQGIDYKVLDSLEMEKAVGSYSEISEHMKSLPC